MKFPSLKFEAGSRVIKETKIYEVRDIVYSTGTDTWYVIYFSIDDYSIFPTLDYKPLEEFEKEFDLLLN